MEMGDFAAIAACGVNIMSSAKMMVLWIGKCLWGEPCTEERKR